MPLMPKRSKHRKMQKGRNRGRATRGTIVSNGEYGLQAVEAGLITGNQIEAARVAMTRYMRRDGKVWIKVFPDKPITRKPAGTRMGKGKGNKEMSSPELEKELGELKTELFKLKFSLATNSLENPMKIRDVKKDIARINTVLTERKIAEKKGVNE